MPVAQDEYPGCGGKQRCGGGRTNRLSGGVRGTTERRSAQRLSIVGRSCSCIQGIMG
ncbi:MAG: hypothetical protein ACFFBV_14915 [Promethearchaeota archaeon]